MIITIDGPAASGKSSAAKILSKRLNLPYLDSGAIYRALAWKVLQKGIDPMAESEVETFCNDLQVVIKGDEQNTVWVNSENVTPFLRHPEVTQAASLLSTSVTIRRRLLWLQREIAKNGVVAEGRDMGTVVFPDADIKFYLDATLPIRGERRFRELTSKGVSCERGAVIGDIEQRDYRDSHRDIAPLYPAAGAVIIDSTSLSLEEVVVRMEQTITNRAHRL